MRLLALTGAVLLASAALTAQNHPATYEQNDGKVDILFSDTDGDQNIYELFLENAPKSFENPGVPRFAIRGKDNKFLLGIGAMIKATASFDWGNPIDNPASFTTYDIPMGHTPGNGGLFQSTFNHSNIFLNFLGLPGTDNQLGAYISGHFTGPGNAFKLHHAFIRYRGILVGHTHSLFTDAAAGPPTIDCEGPNGYTSVTNNVIQYSGRLAQNLKGGIGVEMPMASGTPGPYSAMVNQRIPDVPVFVQYSWGRNANSWLRFAAIIRNMQYRDLVDSKNRDCVGWGVQLSGSAELIPNLRAYYQATYGKGISSYFQDLTGNGLDMVPEYNMNGHMEAVEAWGGYLGLQYNFSKKCFSSITYSMVRDYANNYTNLETGWNGTYKYAQYVAANVFYNVNSFLQVGAEYLYGRRVDMNEISRHDNRLNAMAKINF